MTRATSVRRPSPAALCRAAADAARAAGRIVLERPRPGRVETKTTSRDLVSEIDRCAQEAIRRRLERRFPGIAFIGEEGERSAIGDRMCWYVDPLDGTTNHVHGVPHFAVSVACADGDRVLAGAIHDPVRRELFTAVRGRGAFLGVRRLRVAATAELAQSLLASGFPYDRTGPNNNVDRFARMVVATQGVRRLGSASLDLAYVAAGRFDGYWETVLNPWDFAAGALLVEEAGGRVSSLDGAPLTMASRSVLASNGRLHEALVEALRR